MIAELRAVALDRAADHLRLEVRFDAAPGTIEDLRWSYEVAAPGVAVEDLSVLAALPPAYVLACRLSQDLRVVETLPMAVHQSARWVGALLHRWYGWRPAELLAPIGADAVRPRWARRPLGRGVFFTRGIDSWGKLLRLLDGPRPERPTHLVTVDGDVHLADEVRTGTVAETRAAADRLGRPLVVVRTDLRRLAIPPASGLRVAWIGYSSALVEVDDTRILTDPLWSERPSPIAWIGP